MELQDIKTRARASRQFTVSLGAPHEPRTIELHTPTIHEVKIAGLRAGISNAADAAAMAILGRELLLLAVTGWAGVTCADLADGLKGDSGADGIPWSAAAVPLLLDQNPGWEEQLWSQLVARLAERAQVRESAGKN